MVRDKNDHIENVHIITRFYVASYSYPNLIQLKQSDMDKREFNLILANN